MNALTTISEPPAVRAWALPTFGGVGLAKGCGHGTGAVVARLASGCSGQMERRISPNKLLVLLFVEGAVASWSPPRVEVGKGLCRNTAFARGTT